MSSNDLEASHEKLDGNIAFPPTKRTSHENAEDNKPPVEHPRPRPSNIVEFDGAYDPVQPLNWPTRKKIIITVLYGFTTMCSTWASSIYSSTVASIEIEFNVTNEISTLGVTLFIFGFGLGPLLWAPCSEAYGRRIGVLLPYFIAAIFCFATATAKDIQTVLITRFFIGFFSAAPVTNTGGVMRDLWSNKQRGAAVLCYAMAVVGGPLFSPVVGAALTQSYLGWRWTHYLTGIMMFGMLALDLIVIDETYAKVILVSKAKKLRRVTGDWALHAKHEEDLHISGLIQKFLLKPFQLLFTPICFFIVLHASFVYGIVYLNFAAFQIEFNQVRGWSPVAAGLPFLGVFLGCMIGAGVCLLNQNFYVRRLAANNGKSVPEARLPPMIIGSFALAAGFFIFAWTSPPHVHWIGTCIGGVLMGLGFMGIFQGSTNYLVDTFSEYGASAIAANTLVRNAFAGTFPLFTEQMFHRLGVPWACTLLGLVAVAMIPIPFFFYFCGKRIRVRGFWSQGSLK